MGMQVRHNQVNIIVEEPLGMAKRYHAPVLSDTRMVIPKVGLQYIFLPGKSVRA